MGAKAKGPNPWVKVTHVDAVMADNFQKVDQFKGS